MILNKIRRFLDVAGSIACVIICGILVVGQVSQFRASRKQGGARQATVRLGLKVGDKFPDLRGLDYRKHQKSVLLFLDATCVHCIQSVQTYAHLNQIAAKRPPGSVALVGAFSGGKKAIDEFRTHGFAIPAKEDIRFLDYGISATPTVVVVSPSGTIENFWIGELSSDALRELTRVMEATT